MATYMDYMISAKPIRIIDRSIDKNLKSIKSLTILGVGHLPDRKLFRHQAIFYHWAVVYIANGSGTYRINGGEIQQVRKGSFFLFHPDAYYDYGPAAHETWDEYYFTIEGSRIQEWLDTWLTDPNQVRQLRMDDNYESKINLIFSLMESIDPSNLDRAALLLESLLYELVSASRPKPHYSEGTPVLKLLDSISASINQPFHAAEICKKHFISLTTLRRTVRNATGYSLHEYVHRLKISEAKKLLLNHNLTVKETATTLGFTDVFYFSRLFKKFAGVSPSHYRANM
ncbi:AraC family transcriptional regulator [Paenibacillus sp. YN15]|uniref:helix-turn-helix transcriptional regulator n=1 Tax=Paenibacillus sp. YN15 TaxID=1742774 RepID=UPI00215C19D7|nr:AraC family transcriptional regulator [Paenibacillus sp. YN15]